MKRIYISIIAILMALAGLDAQTNVNIGGGYFGKHASYPGLVLEAEMEHMFTEKASLPLRLDMGFYVHPRQSTGVFLDLNAGFRRYFKSGLFLEESVGMGVLETFLHSDAVYSVDDSGKVSEDSRANPPVFMPSITLGIGYNLSQGSGKQNLIWLRPKIYWEVPHWELSTYSFALQVGFTRTITSR
jgi:hypothetical protein